MKHTPGKTQSLSDQAEAAFQQASLKVIRRAKESSTPVIVWMNGHITEISAEQAQKALEKQRPQPVTRLVSELPKKELRPALGLGKGSIIYMEPDFDAPLEDFKEHMP
jgi:hypothetical protein